MLMSIIFTTRFKMHTLTMLWVKVIEVERERNQRYGMYQKRIRLLLVILLCISDMLIYPLGTVDG